MPKFRGLGGGVWEMTVPAAGTPARERFDAKVAAGELVEVKPAPVKKAPGKDEE